MRLQLLNSTDQDDLNGIFTFNFNPRTYLENCSGKSGKRPKIVKNRKNAKKVHFSNNPGTPGAIFATFELVILEANWNKLAKGQLKRLRLR